MEQENTPGAVMHDADAERRKEAARAMGQARSERKREAVRQNGLLGGAYPMTPETKEKLRAAQSARREREKQERDALGLTSGVSAEKKSPGRPRKEPPVDAAPKRPRGRPKKTADTEPA